MDRRVLDYLMDRVDSRRGGRRDRRRDYEDMEDYRDEVDGRDNRDYRDSRGDYSDSRRGVRGSGRDRKSHMDYDDMPKLSKSDMHHWKQMLENFDGTYGPHYDMQQIMSAAEKSGVKFDSFDEKELCLVVNWLYSDYCRSLKKHVSSDEMLITLIDMAKDFFEDPDGIEPQEKLALLYHCVINV